MSKSKIFFIELTFIGLFVGEIRMQKVYQIVRYVYKKASASSFYDTLAESLIFCMHLLLHYLYEAAC